MSIEKAVISAEQTDAILKMNEGHFLDLKSKRIKPGKLSETISAFSNANGGELYIGIEEEKRGDSNLRRWEGFGNMEQANSYIQLFEELFPLGQFYSYMFLESEGGNGLVLKVDIQKTSDIKKASNGKIYRRRGAQNLPIETREDLRRLELDKGYTTFENETIALDIASVTNSSTVLGFMLEVIPNAEPEIWLRKQQLIVDERPTVAAILLFADEPQAILPKRSSIKIYRYQTKDQEGTRDTLSFDPLTIEGPVYNQIYAAVERTTALIEEIQILGSKGLERIEYPNEALHEIITNAVLHRDYSIVSDTHVRIFDNRIEVESPGTLPGHITKENILTEQFARNGSIVRMVNKFPNPPNKDVGEGLNTAFAAMRSLRLKPPEIDEKENSVLVTIRHESLASPEEAVMEYLKKHDEVTNSIARGFTGITSENTMKNVFYRLRDNGLIEPVPGKKGSRSAWRKPV